MNEPETPSEEAGKAVIASSQTEYSGGAGLSIFVILAGYILDQATKLWTVAHLPLGSHITVIPGRFDWVHFSNTGAAFGSFQDNNRFFIGLSVVALVGLVWSLVKRVFPGRLNYAALLLIISGVLGNGTDRLLHGYVVDFLLFDLGFPPANPWPAFNVADSCICVAVFLLLTSSVLEEIARRDREKAGLEKP